MRNIVARYRAGFPESADRSKALTPRIEDEKMICVPSGRNIYVDPPASRNTKRPLSPVVSRSLGAVVGGVYAPLPADLNSCAVPSAAYIDTDKMGRRLGEVALVDASSRIGQSGRIYYNTLLDENAAAHIAFGSGFGGTRSETPARGVNRSTIHLDVMIGSPELEATGVNERGRRIPLIREGAWQI